MAKKKENEKVADDRVVTPVSSQQLPELPESMSDSLSHLKFNMQEQIIRLTLLDLAKAEDISRITEKLNLLIKRMEVLDRELIAMKKPQPVPWYIKILQTFSRLPDNEQDQK